MVGGCSVGEVCAGADGWTGGTDLLLPAVTGWRFGVIVGASETGSCGGIGAAGSDG